MRYLEQLQQKEWKDLRETILTRDRNTCQKCGNEKVVSGSKTFLVAQDDIKPRKKCIEVSPFGFNHDFKSSFNVFNYPIKSINLIAYVKFFEDSSPRLMALRENPCFDRISGGSVSFDELFELSASDLMSRLYTKGTIEELSRSFQPHFEWKYGFNLQVHHECYRKGRLAWEYPKDDLVTLCWDCHEQLHKDTQIIVYEADGSISGGYTRCPRCFGAGYFPEYEHVEGGVCFRCRGSRFEGQF